MEQRTAPTCLLNWLGSGEGLRNVNFPDSSRPPQFLCAQTMAQSKRPKSAGNEGKKKATAKQALKKKYLSNKSRNDDLREKLDREALALNTVSSNYSLSLQEHPLKNCIAASRN